MKVIPRYTLLLLISFFSSLNFCLAQGSKTSPAPPPPPAPAIEYNQSAWKEFSSSEGRFSILMPGTPGSSAQELKTALGPIPFHSSLLATGTAIYLVSYADFPLNPDETGALKNMLDGGRDKLLADVEKKLISENEMNLYGHTGREWLIQNGELTMRMRCFFIKNRMYQLVILAPRNVVFKSGQPSANPQDRTDFYEATATKFFNSFKEIAAQQTSGDTKSLSTEIVTARPAPEYDADSWKEFSSEKGRFTVLLPGSLAESISAIDSPFGKLDYHTFFLKTYAWYTLSYIDYPETNGIRDVKAFFDGIRDGLLETYKGQLLEENQANRFAYPGRYIKAKFGDGYISRTEFYLIRNRLYVVSVTMNEKDAGTETLKFHEEIAGKFLNSFKPKIEENGVNGKVFGNPVIGKPLGLPVGAGITVDPALSNSTKPEPVANVSGGILNGKATNLPSRP